jgi:iron complex transport system substrate-binding protein
MNKPRRRVLAKAVLTAFLCATPITAAEPPRRIVSLIPAVTEMIFAIGEGGRLVGVGNYDRFPPDVARLPRVGGLLDPSVEVVLGLKPDLVIVYNTQVELKQRLERASIPYYSYEHRALPDITATLRSVGTRIGAPERADQLADRVERAIADVRASVSGIGRPRTLLVFGREPGSLRSVEASGGYGFLHDMLEAAGGENVFADVKKQAVRASTEMILARKPDVIIELRYGDRKLKDALVELQPWNALGSVQAVKSHRLYVMVGDEFVIPGPRVVDAARKLAQTLHPDVRINETR